MGTIMSMEESFNIRSINHEDTPTSIEPKIVIHDGSFSWSSRKLERRSPEKPNISSKKIEKENILSRNHLYRSHCQKRIK